MTLSVGLITYRLDRPLTGIGRYTVELARALAGLTEGPETVLLTAGGPGSLAEENGLSVVPLPASRLLPGLLTFGSGFIPSAVRRQSLDVVHDPTGVTPFLFGAGGAGRVVTIHDVFAWSCPGTSSLLETLIYRCWLPHVLPDTDLVITDSKASKADIVRFLGIPRTKIRVIYAGVSEAYRPQSEAAVEFVRSKYGLPSRYILFVGSVEKRKNLAGLLQAYARLKSINHIPPLVVVGVAGRKGTAATKALNELGLEEEVNFAGYVLDADLPALYSGAELLVFPSLYEGFGLPPLEAMACGTPVLCSDASSLPEVVGDAAMKVDPYDVEGLAEAMKRVLADANLREELRARGLERARQFTWERTARETVAVYRELLG